LNAIPAAVLVSRHESEGEADPAAAEIHQGRDRAHTSCATELFRRLDRRSDELLATAIGAY